MRLIIVLFTALFAASVAYANAPARVALVIGNSNYEHATSLPNPKNDAQAISEKFRNLGFDVVEGYDLSFDDVRSTLRDFARIANEAELAVFFYAGHGIAVNGANYIVPVDASLNDPIDWEFQVYPIDEVLRRLRHANGANIVLLDACRDNPLAEVLAQSMGTSTRSLGARGLSLIDAETDGAGMAIAFATSPGEVAEDGQGEHSPFTEALLKHIGAANTDFVEVMSRVTGEVYNTTEKRQRPWLNTSLTGPVILNPVAEVEETPPALISFGTTSPSPQTNAAAPAASIELQKYLIEIARESNDPADYQNYLDTFPGGLFAATARNAIKRIEDELESTEVALADTGAADSAALQATARQDVYTRTLAAPLTLSATPYVQSQPANQATESALLFDRSQRAEVQGRLNASGNNVGGADGSFGPNTRRGIAAWQSQNGLPPTGFLNELQLQMLTVNTEMSYRTWLASRPVHQPVRQASTRRNTTAQSGNQSSSSGESSSIAESIFKGLAEGIGEGIVRAITD